MESKITRALVLSGGGGRETYECGVYKHLEEADLLPDILVGTITHAAITGKRTPGSIDPGGACWRGSSAGQGYVAIVGVQAVGPHRGGETLRRAPGLDELAP